MRLPISWAVGLSAVGALGLLGSVAYAAGSGYTPTPLPTPSGTPGGYTQVVTAVTVNPTSTTPATVSVTVDGTPVNITVPASAFTTPVQVVITSPVLSQVTSALPNLGLGGYQAVAGLGINIVTPTGQTYPGTFRHPITVTVRNPAIGSGDRVVEWNAQGTFTSVQNAHIANGSASWSFQTDPAFAVLAPEKGAVPGATSPVTGKPFLEEGFAGLLLLGLGSRILFRSRRRNPL